KHLAYSHDSKLMDRCESLSKDILSRVERLGISPSAFARYLYQKARERESAAPGLVFVDATKPLALQRAATISSFWQVNVPGSSREGLGAVDRNGLKKIRTVLANYSRFDQARKIVQKYGIEVIPVGLTFTQQMLDEFPRLPLKASVVLILDDRDYPSLSL